MSDSTKLELCPFCGGKAEYVTVEDGYMITCSQCGASSMVVPNKQKASGIWNYRTPISGCPVCGWNAKYVLVGETGDEKICVKCDNCGLHTEYCDISEIEAVKELWNTRTETGEKNYDCRA